MEFITRIQLLVAFEKADINVIFNAISIAIEMS